MSPSFLSWINDQFPSENEPFSMRDILAHLNHGLPLIGRPGVSRSALYRALRSLRGSAAMRERVRPLNEDEENAARLYSSDAACLIARWATRRRSPNSRESSGAANEAGSERPRI